MKTESGLEYIEVEAGTGVQAEAGKTVSVHYEGKLQDGKVFDSSYVKISASRYSLCLNRRRSSWVPTSRISAKYWPKTELCKPI